MMTDSAAADGIDVAACVAAAAVDAVANYYSYSHWSVGALDYDGAMMLVKLHRHDVDSVELNCSMNSENEQNKYTFSWYL